LLNDSQPTSANRASDFQKEMSIHEIKDNEN